MKTTVLSLLIFWIALCRANASGLIDYIKSKPSVVQEEVIESNPFFRESIEMYIRQPLDHRDTTKGFFNQRVFVSWIGKEAPVVLVTEGYAAEYGRNPKYLNELCPLIKANQVVVEHRFFGKSCPDPVQWDYLTTANAAADHHAVVMLLKSWFTGKWINTGISKGGQTALLQRLFFPGDVDLTVSYVAPVNFGVEDGRHEPYIAKIPGTKADRKKVKEFQKEILSRRDKLMPMFEKFIAEKRLTFGTRYPEIYDFSVLEFSFSFWQWGHNPDEIPLLSSSDEEIFSYWMKISAPDYFSLEGFQKTGPFFIQAARELGYYGYNIKPFRKLLTIRSAGGYLERLFLPANYHPSFNPETAVHTRRFLNTTYLPMIFICGKNDPWCASSVVLPRRSPVLKVVQEGGSHRTRIGNLDEKNRQMVMEKIRQVIPVPVAETVQ